MSVPLGELISTLYREFFEEFRDPEYACVLTAYAVDAILAAEEEDVLQRLRNEHRGLDHCTDVC